MSETIETIRIKMEEDTKIERALRWIFFKLGDIVAWATSWC